MTDRVTKANREVEFLLDGIAPERKEELGKLWEQYGPEFQLLEDDGPAGQFVLEGGVYRLVRFNHRVMRLFWLGAFIAWEGYTMLHTQLVDPTNADFTRFKTMIDVFQLVMKASDSSAVALPDGVPEPGVFPPRADPARGPAELAVFCAGWALLHELRHIQLQQEGKAAPYDAAPDLVRAEEFLCDEYATKFIIERIDDYARQHGVPAHLVHFKRAVGIYFALFTMTLIAKDQWAATDKHPALQDRIAAVRAHMAPEAVNMADAIAHAAFGALWAFWPHAPGPFKVSRPASGEQSV